MAILHPCLLVLAGLLGSLANRDHKGQMEVSSHHDLYNKAFVFPPNSHENYVEVKANMTQELRSYTVCMWSHSDLSTPYALFSYTTESGPHDIVLLRESPFKYILLMKDRKLEFNVWGQRCPSSRMEHICWSWELKTGVVGFWWNGQPSPRQGVPKNIKIRNNPLIILGQQKDSHGDGFVEEKAFKGEMGGLLMWDRELTPEEMCRVWQRQWVQDPIINWRSLNYRIHGDVIVAPSVSQTCMPSWLWGSRLQCPSAPCGCQVTPSCQSQANDFP